MVRLSVRLRFPVPRSLIWLNCPDLHIPTKISGTISLPGKYPGPLSLSTASHHWLRSAPYMMAERSTTSRMLWLIMTPPMPLNSPPFSMITRGRILARSALSTSIRLPGLPWKTPSIRSTPLVPRFITPLFVSLPSLVINSVSVTVTCIPSGMTSSSSSAAEAVSVYAGSLLAIASFKP